jgi:hypothetical protein
MVPTCEEKLTGYVQDGNNSILGELDALLAKV